MLRLCRLIVNFDNREASWAVGDLVDISDTEHDTHHKSKLHDAIKGDCCDHAVRNASSGSFDFVAYGSVSSWHPANMDRVG